MPELYIEMLKWTEGYLMELCVSAMAFADARVKSV